MDVYKKNIKGILLQQLDSLGTTGCLKYFGLWQMLTNLVDQLKAGIFLVIDYCDTHWTSPVSYTHLDVYKRQSVPG